MFSHWEDWLEKNRRAAAGLLVLVTFVVFSGSLDQAFVYDDEVQILQNPFILNSALWTHMFTGSVWSFKGPAFSTNFYRPLHIFSYWLIFRLAGPNPAAFHLFQVLLYAATVVVVYRLGCQLLKKNLVAFAGALLWALHPLHVEAVAWIGGLPDVGFAFFYLLAFGLFLRAERSPGNRLARHATAALALLPALFFKEMALSFPLLVLAYWFFLGSGLPASDWRGRAVRWTPYAAAAMAYLLVRFAVIGMPTQAPLHWSDTPRIAVTALALLGEHARIFLWPVRLNVFRTFDVQTSLHSPWPWLILLVVVGAVTLRKRAPTLGFLVAWWAVTLLPVLDIRQLSVPFVADRFSYLPSVGPCLAMSCLLLASVPMRLPSPRTAPAALAGLIVVMSFWGLQTLQAIPNWRNEDVLQSYSQRESPNAPLVRIAQAEILQFRYGDLDGAQREFEAALRLNAASPRPLVGVTYSCYVGLGLVAQRRGHSDQAVTYLQKAADLVPGRSRAYSALGSLYFPQGDYARAGEYFARAVRADPYDLVGRFYLGTCLLKLGRYREAVEQFRAARQIDPTYTQAYEAEAMALEALGDAHEAQRVRALPRRP